MQANVGPRARIRVATAGEAGQAELVGTRLVWPCEVGAFY
jgi:hypothetical protein